MRPREGHRVKGCFAHHVNTIPLLPATQLPHNFPPPSSSSLPIVHATQQPGNPSIQQKQGSNMATETQPSVDLRGRHQIGFLHTGYDEPSNLMFWLPRIDLDTTSKSNTTIYGVHHRIALIACKIITSNTVDEGGCFTTDKESKEKISTSLNGILVKARGLVHSSWVSMYGCIWPTTSMLLIYPRSVY